MRYWSLSIVSKYSLAVSLAPARFVSHALARSSSFASARSFFPGCLYFSISASRNSIRKWPFPFPSQRKMMFFSSAHPVCHTAAISILSPAALFVACTPLVQPSHIWWPIDSFGCKSTRYNFISMKSGCVRCRLSHTYIHAPSAFDSVLWLHSFEINVTEREHAV